ncbi:hypothetical protein [Piscibacillus halophilus]|uniref:Uncharacterized protein n=1 Tax=Piscibacillus halophilus TaxID=571933 RepID=A0A1H9CC81_9BACI|nr:hypothetical protein [Piscibacillus halophilus]SEP98308.1 hypothetical protein SAMN05216362_10514 [Piscibacillus halophilus]
MSKKEKKWNRFFIILMVFIYVIYAPITIYEWLTGSGGFPLTAIVVGTALPLARKNFLNRIRAHEEKDTA